MNVRSSRNRRNRRAFDPSNIPQGTAVAATVSLVAGKMRLVFPQRMINAATPTEITANALHCTGITQVNAFTFDLAFAAPPVATNPWVIPANSPNFRTANGGYVAAATGVF